MGNPTFNSWPLDCTIAQAGVQRKNKTSKTIEGEPYELTNVQSIASIGIALLSATASLAQHVKTDYDRSATFSEYKPLMENVQTKDQLLVDRIKKP